MSACNECPAIRGTILHLTRKLCQGAPAMKIVWGHWVPRFGSRYTATNLVPKWHQILQVRNGGIGVSMPQHPNFYPCSCKIGGSKDLWQRKNDAGTLWSEIFWGCMGPPVWEVAAIGFARPHTGLTCFELICSVYPFVEKRTMKHTNRKVETTRTSSLER